MINKLLIEINEKMEILNKVVQDNDYFKDLEKRCDFINNRCKRLEHEIERLNNIINELEKWLEELNKPENDMYGYHKQLGIKIDIILDKLKELKEKSNEKNSSI